MRKISILLMVLCLLVLMNNTFLTTVYGENNKQLVGIQLIDDGDKVRLFLLNEKPVVAFCSGIIIVFCGDRDGFYPELYELLISKAPKDDGAYFSIKIKFRNQDEYNYFFGKIISSR